MSECDSEAAKKKIAELKVKIKKATRIRNIVKLNKEIVVQKGILDKQEMENKLSFKRIAET